MSDESDIGTVLGLEEAQQVDVVYGFVNVSYYVIAVIVASLMHANKSATTLL